MTTPRKTTARTPRTGPRASGVRPGRQGVLPVPHRLSEPDAPRPRHVSMTAALDSFIARLTYAHRTLGVRLEEIALTAGLSEKALRSYADPAWNPVLMTIKRTDAILSQHLDAWAKARAKGRDPVLP